MTAGGEPGGAVKRWRVWFAGLALPWAGWFLLRASGAVWLCEGYSGGVYRRGTLPPDCSVWWTRDGWPALLPFAVLGVAVWLAPLARSLMAAASARLRRSGARR